MSIPGFCEHERFPRLCMYTNILLCSRTYSHTTPIHTPFPPSLSLTNKQNRGQGEERSSDDGEPGGTAGRPILSAIESEDLVDVMVVVTR